MKIDSLAVLVLLGLAGGAYIVWKGGKVLEAVNPLNPDNIFHTGAENAVDSVAGDGALDNAADHFFGALDLLNPFNESDTYAKQVWGIGNE